MIHALRLKIYQPTAYFRLPFAYQRRHTYPLPPIQQLLVFSAIYLVLPVKIVKCLKTKNQKPLV